MKRTLIHNATIVNEGQSVKGSVVIEDGRIAEVLTNWKPLSAPCDETIDATGCYLLPGIIDDHVHFRDPGLTHKADILTESRAAAAGGVTSIMDMPNTNPVTTTLDALNAKLDLLNEKCRKPFLLFRCYKRQLQRIRQAGQAPRLRHQAIHGFQYRKHAGRQDEQPAEHLQRYRHADCRPLRRPGNHQEQYCQV